MKKMQNLLNFQEIFKNNRKKSKIYPKMKIKHPLND